MYLFGPSRAMSLGGNYYALIIVDDFSRCTCTLFLKSKSDAFFAFKKLSQRLQNKCYNTYDICIDHGGNFKTKNSIAFVKNWIFS